MYKEKIQKTHTHAHTPTNKHKHKMISRKKFDKISMKSSEGEDKKPVLIKN